MLLSKSSSISVVYMFLSKAQQPSRENSRGGGLRLEGHTSSASTSDGSPTAESTPSPWSSAGRSSDMSLSLLTLGDAGRGSWRDGRWRWRCTCAETLAPVPGDIPFPFPPSLLPVRFSAMHSPCPPITNHLLPHTPDMNSAHPPVRQDFCSGPAHSPLVTLCTGGWGYIDRCWLSVHYIACL